jgi:hypothetical protein
MARPRKNPEPEATEEKKDTQATSSKTKVKLADASKSYSDRTFSIYNDEVKELPDNPSQELQRRIKAGQIVEVK